jgi:hypothetical protein
MPLIGADELAACADPEAAVISDVLASGLQSGAAAAAAAWGGAMRGLVSGRPAFRCCAAPAVQWQSEPGYSACSDAIIL